MILPIVNKGGIETRKLFDLFDKPQFDYDGNQMDIEEIESEKDH